MAMMNAEERDAARAEAHQKRKVLTEYMKHERDPNVGEFENERDFQEKVERLRIYVKPEYDKAVEHYEQQMLDKSTELKDTWMAPDHFGAGGDIGNVFIAASNQRERETSHIGVPGHPAPAYERWLRTHHERAAEVTRREVEAIEQAMLDEGAAAMAGADEEKMDDAAAMEDEEKIVKMLAYKYVEIQAKQAAREKGESDRSKLQKLEEEQRARNPPRKVSKARIGHKYTQWSKSARFPLAYVKPPENLVTGDKITRLTGMSPFAWQREDTRTEDKRKLTEREIADADAMGRSDQVPGPLSIFENDRQREDLERAMVYAAELQAVVDKAEAIKKKKQRRDRKKDGINRNNSSGSKQMGRRQSMKMLNKRRSSISVLDNAFAHVQLASKSFRESETTQRAMAGMAKKIQSFRATPPKVEDDPRKARRKRGGKSAAADDDSTLDSLGGSTASHDGDLDDAKPKKSWFRSGSRKSKGSKGAGGDGDGGSSLGSGRGGGTGSGGGGSSVNSTPMDANTREGIDPEDWRGAHRLELEELMTPADALVAEELIKEAVAIEEKRAAAAELQAKAAAKLADSLEVEVESGQVTIDQFLRAAGEGDHPQIALGLVQSEALEVNAIGKHGTTALFTAFKMLLDVEKTAKTMTLASDHVIQLNLELCADLEKCVWLLLCMGADIQCKEELSDSTGYSLLHYAVITGNLRRASQLLRQGANVDPQNVSGVTPLMEAAKWGRPECVIVLLKVGGYLERRDKDGNGALHYSGMYGRKQLSRLLLIAGANKAARNFALKTPADLAKKNKQTVTAEQILLYRHSSSIDRDKVSTRLDALDLFNVKREEKREAMRRELEEAKKGLEEQEKLQAEMAADIETAQRTTWGRTYNGDEIAALTGKELTQYKRRLKRYEATLANLKRDRWTAQAPPFQLAQYEVYGKCWGDSDVVEALFGREKVVFDRKKEKFEKKLQQLEAAKAKADAKKQAAQDAEAEAMGNETTVASETMMVTAMDEDEDGTFVTELPSIDERGSGGGGGGGERAPFDFAAAGY